MRTISRMIALSVAVLLVAAVAPALALPTLDFGIVAPTSGTLSFAGGSASLVGVNIEVDSLVGLNTPVDDGVTRVCHECRLNFTTGALISSTADTWVFGGGGGITLVGGIGTGGNDIAPGTLLLAGEFTGSPTVMLVNGAFKIAGAAFTDVKSADLATLYGLAGGPNLPWSGGFNISFNAEGTPPDAFVSAEVLSGDVVNSPVPEPLTLFLFGSGLVGLAGYTRARGRRA